MRFVRWEREAIDDLLSIPDPAAAAIVDRAVNRFASAGQGFVRRVSSADATDDLRLYVVGAPYYVRLRFDHEAVYVWRVVRS